MPSPLRELLELMTQSVDALERVCEEKGTPIPDLDAPFTPQSEAFRKDPAAAEATKVIVAAAHHICAIVSRPTDQLYTFVAGPTRAAAVRTCLEANVSEILREAGPSGMHVKDIAEKNGHDAEKLARFLRYLATGHIFREIAPDVFAHNRVSSMLDTHKPSEEVIAKPESKYDNTRGVAAQVSHHLDLTFKAASQAWETLADPQTRLSNEPEDAPFARAFPADKTLWNLLERDAHARNRFDLTMIASAAAQPPDAIFRAFAWETLPADALVVEVGGGMGTSAFPLAARFPRLRLVVQDLPGAVATAAPLWAARLPAALASGRVLLQPHDCFAPQPHAPAVFLLKMILHDWPDAHAARILARLRAAARADTVLVLVDCLVPYACRAAPAPAPDGAPAVPGAADFQAPAPLLANYGAANEFVYIMDMMMHMLFNAQERTVPQFTRLLQSEGWGVRAVHRTHEGNGIFLQSIEAVPI
ncbi:S-adenosyl-L-methionine-dependent methyltransferase [Phanerochaete sordida]|uniref:S-adenosyl-L-methionine-dependent methyltransferase n=1 Tax=Phanerochaete sordida TaxID=48140 RepID=A0A9P3L7H8_9APHY|nr:S-adenosyl-L-methionine-dependent methyltransferase [Phanerochaete sordida]